MANFFNSPAQDQGLQQQQAQQQQYVAGLFEPQAFQQRIARLADPATRAMMARQLAQQMPPPPPDVFNSIVGSGNRQENAVGLPQGQLGDLMQPQPQVPTTPMPGVTPPGLGIARAAQAVGPTLPSPATGLSQPGGSPPMPQGRVGIPGGENAGSQFFPAAGQRPPPIDPRLLQMMMQGGLRA